MRSWTNLCGTAADAVKEDGRRRSRVRVSLDVLPAARSSRKVDQKLKFCGAMGLQSSIDVPATFPSNPLSSSRPG
jgi:hypothetical protein